MLDRVGADGVGAAPAEVVTDKGYHARDLLKDLEDSVWKSRIAEKDQKGFARWHGDDAARRAVYNNRARLKSSVAHRVFKLRTEKVEGSFALLLDIGGLRRTWLRGVANVEKRYTIQVAAYNLGLVLRHHFGVGTPRQATAAFWLIIDVSWNWGVATWAVLGLSNAGQETTAGASPVVLIYLLVFSV
jgi:transposase